MRYSQHKKVEVLRPGRSVFDLSYAKKMSGKMGYLYPVMCDEMVPGDMFDITAEAVIRFAPMVAPVLHEIVLKADYFFVPFRICFNTSIENTDGRTTWERFITGGQDGDDASVLTRINSGSAEGDLLDHLGCVPGVTLSGDDRMLAFPLHAYNIIYNEYYRDPNLEACRAIDNVNIGLANWDADYFTRALPFQQRGTTPALPVTGSAEWTQFAAFDEVGYVNAKFNGNATGDPKLYVNDAEAVANAQDFMNSNTLNAVAVDIAELRVAAQLQRWLERSARTGYRYTEFLQSFFGVSPRDERLDRPEYIGGLRQSIVISEVLQNNDTETTPLGYMGGHGIMAGRHGIGRYHAKEFGVIMCLLSIAPRPAYQQGIDRQWLRVSRYDYYFPQFANLSEQEIYNMEIYAKNSAGGNNRGIWGYQGRYDEMRSKQDKVSGAFRSTLNYWHSGRIFADLPALSSTFGHTDPAGLVRIFKVTNEDHLYVHWGNRIKAIRPLPPVANPGRMDHEFGGY